MINYADERDGAQFFGKILVIDDTPDNLRALMELLKNVGFKVLTAISGKIALRVVSDIQPDLILLDIIMPDMDGYEICRRLKENPETADIPVLFISGLDESTDKLKAFSTGGVDFIHKPFNSEEVLARVKTHLDLRRALQMVQKQKDQLEQEKLEREKTEQELNKFQTHIEGLLTGQLLQPEVFKYIVTHSSKMQGVFQYVEALSCSSEPVLILGESGVGKELIAKAIHDVSSPEGPWVAVNIAGFDDNHFSDTLFGHVRGAFTGADLDRPGMIEKATGGTLFLDEIGDLSMSSQVKLLRLLQEMEFHPLGCDMPRQIDTRILVATNTDLKQKIEQGTFRQDLFYRLATHRIEIPPLRERKEDIPLLVEYFMSEAAGKLKKKKPSYPPELLTLLSTFSFPGNIRELRSMVYDALSKHKNRMMSMDSFLQAVGLGNASKELSVRQEMVFPDNLPTIKENAELLVKEALQRTDGNQRMAAKLLGITRGALSARLKKSTG